MKKVLPAALLGLSLACATNPVTGKREISLMSEGQEIAIGQENHPQILREMGQYNDPELQRYVSDIGLKLAKPSERPNLPWTFTVVDQPVVNAFAVPGGFIYITRGILAHLDSEAQLVGVLGHELGLLFLKYGRDDELQSDALGAKYAVANGWDPRAVPEFLSVLARMREGSEKGIPNWLSTHPEPASRVQEIQPLVQELTGGRTDFRVDRDPYLQRVDGMIFGDNPEQGIV